MALSDITDDELLCATAAADLLPDSAINAVIAGLTSAQDKLQAGDDFVQAEILNLDIILAPLVAQKIVLQSIIDRARAQFTIISQTAVNQCPALGTLNQVVGDSFGTVADTLSNTLNLINAKEAIKLEYQSRHDEIQDKINYIGRLKTVFSNALTLRQQTKLAFTTTAGVGR